MSRNLSLLRTIAAGLLLLSPFVSFAQERWQIGPDGAFSFQRFYSNDGGGIFKPRFNAVSGIGGLHVSRRLSRWDAWAEMGICYTPLDASIAETNQPGYWSSGVGSGLWIIPTLLRKDIILRLPETYFSPKRAVWLSFSTGLQHQFLTNLAGWRLASGLSGNGSGLNYTVHTTPVHTYNPALFAESAIRLLLIRRRLHILIRYNATLGLHKLIRTDIRYTTSPIATPQLATVNYNGSGTGWGIGLRYLIY